MEPEVSEQVLDHFIEHGNILLPANSNSTSPLVSGCCICLGCVGHCNVLRVQ